MEKHKLEYGVSRKIENTHGETIYIGILADIQLKKYSNIMVLYHGLSLGIVTSWVSLYFY